MDNVYMPLVREAARRDEPASRKLAAVVVAFLETNNNIAFEAMADLMGITLSEQGALFEQAQRLVEKPPWREDG